MPPRPKGGHGKGARNKGDRGQADLRTLMGWRRPEDEEDMAPAPAPRRQARQVTIESMGKVVRMEHSAANFREADVARLRGVLEAGASTEEAVIGALRQLDSMQVTLDVLRSTGIGKPVSRMAKDARRPALQSLAARIKCKWRRIALSGSDALSAATQLEERVRERDQVQERERQRRRKAVRLEEASD